MLVVLGIVSLLLWLVTFRVRNVMTYSNLGYAALAFGLLIAGTSHARLLTLAAAFFGLAGALLLLYGSLVRKEVRNFRESLLPK